MNIVDASGWLQLVALVLDGAVKIATLLEKRGVSVLTHCSDGWDRTSQLCSLVQLMLDPFYRTIYGFEVLIEKEWVHFGHMFAKRCGHTNRLTEEVSPIFLLFMDCVWQMTQQFPCYFEFNETFLLFVLDNVYSCRFGTFLCNCEREALELQLSSKTISIWTYVNCRLEEFRNVFYTHYEGPLIASAIMKRIRLWDGFYLRWHKTAPIDTPEGMMAKLADKCGALQRQIEVLLTSNPTLKRNSSTLP